MAQFGPRISAGHLAAQRAKQRGQAPGISGAIGRYGEQARNIGSAIESQFPSEKGVATQFAESALPQLAQGGFSPAQDIAARRGISRRYQSALGRSAQEGARGGFYSGAKAARVGQREAGASLAPALVGHESNVARQRHEGLRSATGYAVPLAQSEQRAQAAKRSSFGDLLGRLMRRGSGIPRPSQVMRGLF